MKKIALILSIASLGAISAMAQGSFLFGNTSANPIKVATGTDAGSLAAATAVGVGNPTLGAGSIQVELFVAVDGSMTLAQLEGTAAIATSPVGPPNSASPAALGKFGGNIIPLPGFDGSKNIEYAFYGMSLDGKYGGWSALGTGYTPATGITPPEHSPFGTGTGQIGGWTLTPLGSGPPIPEPSTLALGGLGAAALMFLRRRK